MAAEMRDPERIMRRAGWIVSGFAAIFYVSATAAFLVVLPAETISELNGFAEGGRFSWTHSSCALALAFHRGAGAPRRSRACCGIGAAT